VAQKQRRHRVAPRVEIRLFSLTLRLRSVKTHKMADNQRHLRYGGGNRPRCNASRRHDSRHEDRERSSRFVGFDLRPVSLQTQPSPGSAGLGSSLDPPPGSSFSAAAAKVLGEPSEQEQAGVDSKKQEFAITATAGKAVTRPPFDFADRKTSHSCMFTEFVSSSSSLLTQSSFSLSAKPTASSPGVGFNFSSPSEKAPEKLPEQDQDSVVSKSGNLQLQQLLDKR
jgi:hypothetical protein